MEEILPGLIHWSAFHDGIGQLVHSSFVCDSGTLLDPMEPEGGLDAIAAIGSPQRIVLSNRHHFRHSAAYTERFQCSVLCHEAGLGHFRGEHAVSGFTFGQQLADGVRAVELASICAEETALLLSIAGGVLSFGDGLRRSEDGLLAFMPDDLLGEDPETVKSGLRSNLTRMLDEEFDTLLFAHADPVLADGRSMLREFLAREEASSQ
ncbi:MAG TPA: hypothetical protein VGL57_12050 [Solirubrobacteraceae bacterium]|jgi:hypothetical protein